jgi:aromatic-L-amino-acid/L-tryptophan decarboxylase
MMRSPLGDIADDELRDALHRVAEWIADFRRDLETLPVAPDVAPGEFAADFSSELPSSGVPIATLLDEFERTVPRSLVHWAHPRFLGYFGWTTTGPGIVAEALTSALNVNAMTWRTSPGATELETVVVGWIRRLLGLPDDYFGIVYDTASVSTMHALACARERAVPNAAREGLRGPALRVYASDQAHNSIEKGAIALGIGSSNVVRVASDDAMRMRIDALDAAIERDRADGRVPAAVVATMGTTSTAASDDIRAIADVCARHGLWLHVDAAYGGAVALLPECAEIVAGFDRADSIVFNPHKWLFVPLDFSVLFTRHREELRAVFSLKAEYLHGDAARAEIDYMDFGLQLGRRFRALKAWMVLRAFGADGLRERIREHRRLARVFAQWVDDSGGFEVVAPVDMGVVCFQFADGDFDAAATDGINAAIVDAVIASGRGYLTQTRVRGRTVMRIGLGNILTTEEHLATVWAAIRAAAESLVQPLRC